MMDQMGEVEYAPGEPKGTPWHPHRGFETVTYIIDGVFDHQDSHGGGGTITNGDTQWMTAGSGLLHIEAPPEWLVQQGGLFHGIQLWVNLPRDAKMNDPRYQDIRSGRGRAADLRPTPARWSGSSPARSTGTPARARRSPRCRWCTPPSSPARVSTCPGTSTSTPWSTSSTARAPSAPRDARSSMGQSAVLGAGDYLTITADGSQESRSPKMDVIVVGGRPIREPLAWAGPFVMNTKSEVMQAYEDFQRGHFGHIPGHSST